MAEAPAADTLFLALDRRSGEADSDVEEQPLTEELDKVRGTLRGNLVPEARALVSDEMADDMLRAPEARAPASDGAVEDMLRAPLIWLLASGTKPDHVSIAALGAALQRAGYRVKVFGAGCFGDIFARLGLAFEEHDAHPLMHRHNRKAQQWLTEFSKAVGMNGPGKEDDLFFDLHVLRLEHTCSLSIRSDTEKDSEKSGFAVAAVLSEHRFNDLFIRSDCSDGFKQFIGERYHEVLAWRATERRRSIENFVPVHGAHMRAFREFVRQKAEELGFDRIDVIETLRFEFVKSLAKLMEQAAREGRDASSVLRHEVADFLAWLNGESPREWWQRWNVKLPAWMEEIPHVRTSQHTVPKAMHNVIMTIDNSGPHERPDLVLNAPGMLSVGLMLEARYQVKTAMLWPYLMALHRGTHIVLYNWLVSEEKKERIPCTPVQDMGPMAFSDMLWGERQISGQPPLRLKDELTSVELRSSPVLLQALRGLSTGLWTVEGDPRMLPPEEPLLWSDPGDYERAKDFLGDGSDPPVVMSWGKRRHPKEPIKLAYLVAASLHAVGRRGVFLAGKSGASLDMVRKLAENKKDDKELQQVAEHAARCILVLADAPHGWLFPQCSCLVHHGGHGTVQSALISGVPQVLVPPAKLPDGFPNNGDMIKGLGCGTDATPLEDTTPKQLITVLRSVLENKVMKAKAAEVAKKLQRQPGVLGAVALVSDLLQPSPPRPPQEPQAFPWLDGVWGFYYKGTKAATNIVKGGGWYDPDGRQSGWIRAGGYRTEKTKSLPEGHSFWNVQAFWPSANAVSYGVVGSEGKRITWDDLNVHMWESELPTTPQEEESFFTTFPGVRLLGGLLSQLSHQIGGDAGGS